MLTRIVHNSPHLCAFLDQLHLDLSQPQRQHMLNLADALLKPIRITLYGILSRYANPNIRAAHTRAHPK